MFKNGMSKKLKNNLFVYSLIGYPLILFIIFYVVVNFNSIILAFQTIDGTGKHFAGFDNFKLFWNEMMGQGQLLSYSFTNSIKMYFINLAVTTPLCIIFGYIVYKKCFGHKMITFLLMIPSMMSGLVVSLLFVNFIGVNGPLAEIFKIFGINDGKWMSLLFSEEFAFGTSIFYSIWLGFALSILVYPTTIRAIDPAIFESARIDGVTNMLQELRYIIIPLIYPTMTTFFVTGFAAIFSNAGPLMEFYYTAAPDYVSNMGYYFNKMILVDTTEFNYPKYAAGGLILTLIVAPLTLLLKYFLEKLDYTNEPKKKGAKKSK